MKNYCCYECDFFIDDECKTDSSQENEQEKNLISEKYLKPIEIVNEEFICQDYMKKPV
jgi:hypothetical protein